MLFQEKIWFRFILDPESLKHIQGLGEDSNQACGQIRLEISQVACDLVICYCITLTIVQYFETIIP